MTKIAFQYQKVLPHFCIVKENLFIHYLMSKYILSFAFLLSAHLLIGQGWERIYSGGGQDEAFDVEITPDGGYILAGFYNGNNLNLIKVDVDGFLQWNKINIVSAPAQALAIEVAPDTSYYITGWQGTGTGRNGMLVKTDFSGNLIWNKSLGVNGVDEFNDLALLSDGSVVLVGYSDSPEQMRVVKTAADGTLIWAKTFGLPDFEEKGSDVVIAENGDIVVTGYRRKIPNQKDIYVVRINPGSGDVIWEQVYAISPIGEEEGTGITRAKNGDFIVAGYVILPGGDPNSRGLVMKISGNGDAVPLWIQTQDFINKASVLNDIESDGKSGYVVTGRTPEIADIESSTYIARLDDMGVLVWENSAKKSGLTEGYAVSRAADGGFVAVGYASSSTSPLQPPRYAYMVKTDADGNLFTNYISGNIFNDLNNDCELQSNEAPLKNWLIKVSSPDFTRYTATQPNGDYFLMVDSGIYDIKVYPPNGYWSPCQSSITVPVLGFYDTIRTNIGIRREQICPYNEVDIQTPILRRCTNNTYTVRYCNSGTSASQNTKVVVVKSPDFSIVSASKPYTVQGDSLIFDIGLVLAGNCGDFTIDAFLDCDVALTSAHCMRAFITPDAFCGVIGWDGAIIEASAKCKNGRVKLSLTNRGTGVNGNELGYVIIEDLIVLRVIPPNNEIGIIDSLFPGEDTLVYDIAATGKTYRIIAEQTNGYPGMSIPTAAIEGCKTDTTTNTTTGFYTVFPEDDAEPFTASDCQETYETDFNPDFLKRGHPKGYKDPHYIKPQTDIDYLIRFQNTGTDSVHQVFVRDTLSPWLDPASVRPGTASHPYTYSVYGDGIVQFTLTNINLGPTGSSNSEGYVKFRVSQKPNVPCGSEILNTAAIGFDFNESILTNETFHTVCDSFLEVSVQSKEIYFPGADLRVYPNPFVESTTFEVTGVLANSYLLEIVDAQGRLVFNRIHTNATFRLYRDQLPAGLLFYRLAADGKPIAAGKLLVH
jgi:hypothetical protein